MGKGFIIKGSCRGAAWDRLKDLSPKERIVARHLAAGEPNKVIAHRLNRSKYTIRNQVGSVCRKLECQNRTEAAAKLVSIGVKPVKQI